MSEDNHIPDDEIDLLDLFVVLLKHRKMILYVMLFVLTFVSIGYFIIPNQKFTQQKEEYSRVNMVISCRSEAAQYTLSSKEELFFAQNAQDIFLSKQIIDLFLNPVLLSQSLQYSRIAELMDYQEISEEELVEKHIGSAISTKDSDWSYNAIQDSNTLSISMSFNGSAESQLLDFMRILYDRANSSLLVLIKQDLYIDINAVNSNDDSLIYDNDSLYRYALLRGFNRGEITPLLIIEEPIVVKIGTSLNSLKKAYFKMGLIIIFAVFFLLLFLAFILEFIANLKEDESRMKKIRNALRKS